MAKRIIIHLDVDDKGSIIVKKFTDTTKKSLDGVSKSTKDLNKDLDNTIKNFKLMAAAATVAVAAFTYKIGKDAVKAASDLQEMTSKFNVVFKDTLVYAEESAKVLVNSYGLSTREAKQYLASVQDLLVPMGMVSKEAARLSDKIVKLSVDLGSFNNQKTENVMLDIQSALVGNFETMKKYGVVLNETVVKNEAYRLGLAKQGEVLNANQKAQAAYSLMVKGSAAALGDWARTSDGFANQLKQFHANIEEFEALLGEALLPVLTDIVKKFNTWAKETKDAKTGTTNLTDAVDKLVISLRFLYEILKMAAVYLAGSFIGSIVTTISALSARYAILAANAAIVNTQVTGWAKNLNAINPIVDTNIKKVGNFKIALEVLNTQLKGLSLGIKFLLFYLSALAGYELGKVIDGWMQHFDTYRKFIVKTADIIGQAYILIKDMLLHPIATENSRAALKKELDAHAALIRKWKEDIKTETTTGTTLPGMPAVSNTVGGAGVGAGGAGGSGGMGGSNNNDLLLEAQKEFIKDEKILLEMWYKEKKDHYESNKEALILLEQEYQRRKLDLVIKGIEDEAKAEDEALEETKKFEEERLNYINSFRQASSTLFTPQSEKEMSALEDFYTVNEEGISVYNQNVQDAIENTNQWKVELQNIANASINNVAYGLADIATGAQSAKEAFADMARSIISDLIAIGVKLMIIAAIKSAFPGVGSFLGMEKGGIAPGGFQAFAAGGIASKPTIGLIGEGAMNEAVVPLPDGRSIPVALQGGVGNNFNININVKPDKGNMQEAKQYGNIIARTVKTEVEKIITNNKRPGGLLNRQVSGVY